jgi:N6-adenosine-specific RNA methylase IME4
MAKEYQYHPFAEVFPLIAGDDFQKLVDDIRENGLREDITLLDGKILDGRNRDRACRAAEVEPRYRDYAGDTSPWGLMRFVVSLNVRRRHLPKEELAICAAEAEDLIAKFTLEGQQAKSAGQKKGGRTAGRGRPKVSTGSGDSSLQQIAESNGDVKPAPTTREKLALMLGVNARYVGEAISLKRSDRKTYDEVKARTKRLSQVKAERKKLADAEKRKAQSEIVASRPPPEVLKEQVKFNVVLVDDSWYRGPNDAGWLEIANTPVADYAAEDAIVFVRTAGSKTAVSRAEAIIAKWGFTMIDDQLLLKGAVEKVGKWFKRSVEEIVIGVRGTPDWPEDKPDGIVQCAPGKVHALIESLTPTYDNLRLELGSQRIRKGWVCWPTGKEPVAA